MYFSGGGGGDIFHGEVFSGEGVFSGVERHRLISSIGSLILISGRDATSTLHGVGKQKGFQCHLKMGFSRMLARPS